MTGWRCFEGPDLAPLAEAWEQAGSVAPATVFQSFALARRWAEVFAEAAQIRVWVHRPEPLIIPTAARDGVLMPLGEGLFDYVDAVGEPGRQAEAAEMILNEPWGAMQCTGVREDSAFAGFWQRLGGAGEPYSAAPRRAASAPALEAEHPRQALRWRRARTLGLEVRPALEPAARSQLLDWMFERKAARLSRQGEHNVLGPREQRWLEVMTDREPQLSELWSLRRGNQILAGLLCWQYRRVRYAYTIAHEQEAAALSPGVLLLFVVLGRTMEAGWEFDFLTGEQPFKQRFATHRVGLRRYRAARAATKSGDA